MAKAQAPVAGMLDPNRLKSGHAAHVNDETDYGFGGGLPPGIEGGVALIVECKIGKYEKGEGLIGQPYFYARAVAVAPEKLADGTVVAGGSTSIGPEPLCDTPNRSRKTFEDHWGWVLNELAKLGVDRHSIVPTDEGVKAVCDAIKNGKIYTKFRTWAMPKQEITHEANGRCSVMDKNVRKEFSSEEALKKAYPFAGQDPRTNHDWKGAIDYSNNGAAHDAVVDNTSMHAAADDGPSHAEAEPEQVEDLVALGRQADNNDGEAAARLDDLAKAAGIDPSAIDTWEEVGQQLMAGAGAPFEEDGDLAPPNVTECYWVKGTDLGKKGPGSAKRIECETIAVDKATKTCTMKDIATKKEVSGISWDKLHDTEKD